MYHVCYLSYSESLNLYYIGKKSFKEWFEFIEYKTSSSNIKFRDSIKTKTILGYYDTSKEAIEAEIYFQHLFKVKDNPVFANKCYQTSKGFDTLGFKFKLTKAQKEKRKANNYPRCHIEHWKYKKCNINFKEEVMNYDPQKKKPRKSSLPIESIKQMISEGKSQQEIASHFKINQSTVSRIKGEKRNAYT